MNYLSITTVREIITLASTCYPVGGEPSVISLSDAVDFSFPIEENSSENALYAKVSSLTAEQLAELQTLMLIGRGAGGESAGDWTELYQESLASQTSQSVDYVASKYQLPEYLQTGLTELGL
ncbi:DUF3775 domain-containing protein [Vibrio lentus]|uniref:DUF3775 domain-containing protein n=1 Tax=Vibrio lentus TaxID=136468 RepID=UPI000CC7189D|nr:DUF3775 domain-containing protein [Vibrio lentus]PMM38434.1 hypothetical protein BCT58_24280 [Vibrio lentus]